MGKDDLIEWVCKYCGRKETKFENTGRPMAGTCARNGNKAHIWLKNQTKKSGVASGAFTRSFQIGKFKINL